MLVSVTSTVESSVSEIESETVTTPSGTVSVVAEEEGAGFGFDSFTLLFMAAGFMVLVPVWCGT